MVSCLEIVNTVGFIIFKRYAINIFCILVVPFIASFEVNILKDKKQVASPIARPRIFKKESNLFFKMFRKATVYRFLIMRLIDI